MDLDNKYIDVVHDLSQKIRDAKYVAIRKANNTLMELYFSIGEYISSQKLVEGYGKGVVERLSIDLKQEFPDMGLSPRNIWNMKMFYERYKASDQKLLRSVAELGWGQNLLIMNKTKDNEEALHYAQKSIALSLTRDMLLNYIKADDYAVSKALPKSHNFEAALPENIAAQADEIIKSKYNLGFLGVAEKIHELNFEKKLVEKIKLFILELGKGFSYIGNQYRLEYNEKEYVIDMLFFNRHLRSLVAIDLKMGEFKPEYAGKMNAYLNILDRQVKTEDENPSIGIILCASKDHVDVEIALHGINKPIGVAEYQLQLPAKELKEMIQREIANDNNENEEQQ